MHPEKIKNLVRLNAADRYDYFIRHCADFGEIWGLCVGEEDWIIFTDNENEEIFPVWPHPELASLCAFSEHKEMGAIPRIIKIESFLQNCIPDMIRQSVLFGVFYDLNRTAIAVDPGKLKNDLEAERSELFGDN